jgi:hypothetical protein
MNDEYTIEPADKNTQHDVSFKLVLIGPPSNI